MKKIISLAIATVLLALSLVSCENGVGDFQYDYTPPVVKDISLNMYIICEDDCNPIALTTVADDIADYTETKYKTKVNVIYKTASEYLESVRGAVSSTDNSVKAGIVLINNKSLMDELMAGDGKLLDLTAMYKTKAFGRLNSLINPALLQASAIASADGNKYYTVPNNRVLGEYTYLVLDKQAVKDAFISKEKVDAFASYDDAIDAGVPASAIQVVVGSYEKRFEFGDTYYCNVIEKPTVKADDAFASAFAVVKGGAIPKNASVTLTDEEFASRAMEIIFAINTDSALRNLLQYGRENSNYIVADGDYDENGVLVEKGDYDLVEDATVAAGSILLPDGTTIANPAGGDKGYVLVANGTFLPKVGTASYYNMNFDYTGDVFKAAYSYYEGLGYGWSADMAANGTEQNKDVTAE